MSVYTITSTGQLSATGGKLGSHAAHRLWLEGATAEAKVRGNRADPLRYRVDAADDDPDRKRAGGVFGAIQSELYGGIARADGFSATAGLAGAEDNVSALMWRIVPQVQPRQNYREFQIDSTLAAGMQQYQIAFESATGEAQAWAGDAGGIQPLAAGWSMIYRPQYHFITEAPVMFIQAATFAAMGSDLRTALNRQATLAHSLVANRLTFQGGGSDLDVWGLKNYPTLAIDYTGLSLASATGAQIAQAISDCVVGVEVDSKQAITVDTLMLPTSLKSRWSTLYPGGTGSDQTLGAWFAENFPGVRVVWANELDDLLASGVHAMFAYQSRGDSAPSVEASPVLFLPEYQRGVGVHLYAYSRYGGMVIGHTVGARLAAIED